SVAEAVDGVDHNYDWLINQLLKKSA
ncbi:MAG: Unknown protein, partial [uncultured Thiotrichaceae bacterium]